MYLRSITMKDAPLIFSWINLHEVRSNSFAIGFIDYETHKNWISRALQNQNKAIYIIVAPQNKRDTDHGVVRFDIDGEEATIGVYLPKYNHGKGYGTKAIIEGCNKMFDRGVVRIKAYIKSSNTTSIKSFTKAGFAHQIDSDDKTLISLLESNENAMLFVKTNK